jgi:hypothetical protein
MPNEEKVAAILNLGAAKIKKKVKSMLGSIDFIP